MTCVTSTQCSLIFNGNPLETFKAKHGVRQGDSMSPLLFVIGMEYLSRILKVAGEAEEFSLHLRCSKMKLTHLIFADDLMLFSKENMQFIKILTKGVETFSSSSGLKANCNKSAIYLAGVSDSFRSHAASTLDFAFESLPVKYLGMPLISKRSTTADYDYLVEKLTNRIHSWFARNLSYTARLQLVNSVLISITNYWSQTVILPKRVLNQIKAPCRFYLWLGETESNSPGNVSWEKVCRPKQEGGLGIRNLQQWNLAAVGKIAWHISFKKDSLWIK